MFRYRSFTPLPFLLLMVVFARPTLLSLVAGLLVVILGEGLRFWGVAIVGAETRTTGTVGGTYLVTTGPFAYLRNPLYLGNMLVYAGIGIMSWALFPWLLLAAFLWFGVQYTLIIEEEEKYLEGKFGAAYRRYCSLVRRFLPRFHPYTDENPAPKRLDSGEGIRSEKRTLQAIGLVTALLFVLYILRT
jgi:protein-S-isoprenylcysteine O-methyltransferase Ste14